MLCVRARSSSRGVELTEKAILAVKGTSNRTMSGVSYPYVFILLERFVVIYVGSFDAKADEDLQFISEKWMVSVVMDRDTLEYVNGSVVDWVDDERGTGFLVENPRQKKFKGKFFNRKTKPE